MTDARPSGDAVAVLNDVLSEVLDAIQEAKQARRKVPGQHALHEELDQLFDDLRRWARLLVEEDDALGVSPLSSISSTAGRTQPNLWPAEASDDDVRATLADLLNRLDRHVLLGLEAQEDEGAQALLEKMHQELSAHEEILSEPTI